MKHILFILLISTVLLSNTIKGEFVFDYYKDFDLANQEAVKQNKPLVLFIVTKHSSSYALYKNFLNKEEEGKLVKDNFIVLIQEPEELTVNVPAKGTPSTWFFKDGKPMFKEVLGMHAHDKNIYMEVKKAFYLGFNEVKGNILTSSQEQ